MTGAEEEVLAWARVAAWLLPHAVKAINAISDTAPSVSLRRINISPSFEKEIEQRLAGWYAGRQ